MNDFIVLLKEHIEDVMKDHPEFKYEILIYNDYDAMFFKETRAISDYKIFFFDVEMPSVNGFEAARKVRKYDEKSYILFLTSYHEKHTVEANNALVGHLMYINKDEYKEKTETSIKHVLTRLDQKTSFRFQLKDVNIRIDLNNLNYILYEKISRKSTFYNANTYIISDLQLCEIYENLDERYYYSHRACIVNVEQIKDITKTEIIFKNEQKITYLSRTYRKALIRAWQNYKNTH